ncbi:hypothetical protein BV25DRAFT_1466974 [Artomyces pyxidatus]|uniref:Uncharacterized protein n=1 Tax=Artomyces pyxidatus TaxID=48021 RepID=A0ACB8SLB4_9AGAM|nr:hypothetical protein BV25DRAFT_1466974 [Artomyces pyxidatus]
MMKPEEFGEEADTRNIDSSGHSEDRQFYREETSKLWSSYLKTAGNYDRELVETWKGDAEGILIFTGLFSATLAAFIIESYKGLQRDPSDSTVYLLSQISQQLAASANGTQILLKSPPQFHPSPTSVRVNTLWFLSLCLSLTCALAATLMQQWARRYLHLSYGRYSDAYGRARIRTYVYQGAQNFGMTECLAAVPSLLHLSVFLFFAGLVDFLLPINSTVAYITLALVIVVAVVYAVLTALPLAFPNCPYRTPLSPFLWQLVYLLEVAFRAARRASSAFGKFVKSETAWSESWLSSSLPATPKFAENMDRNVAKNAAQHTVAIVGTALCWHFQSLETRNECEQFLDGLNALVTIHTDVQESLRYLIDQYYYELAFSLSRLLASFADTHRAPLVTRERRAVVCLRAIWHLAYCLPPEPAPIAFFFCAEDLSVILSLAPFRNHEDPRVAIIASCIQTYAVVTKSISSEHSTGSTDLPTLLRLSNAPPALLDTLTNCGSGDAYLLALSGFLSDVLPHLDTPSSAHWHVVLQFIPAILRHPSHCRGALHEVREVFLHVWDGIHRRAPQSGFILLADMLRPIRDALQESPDPDGAAPELQGDGLVEEVDSPAIVVDFARRSSLQDETGVVGD